MSQANSSASLKTAEAARDSIHKDLSRLQAQQRGVEAKIAMIQAKLSGAEMIVEALQEAQKAAVAEVDDPSDEEVPW